MSLGFQALTTEEENIIRARGFIVHRVVQLEMLINLYLATHFAGKTNARWELINTVFATNRITIDSKIDIFRVIVEIHNPEFKLQHPKYFSDFKEIIEKRNWFAHLHSDVLKENNKDQIIYFLKFSKANHDFRQITYQEVQKLVDMINSYVTSVGSLMSIE